jgi:hypothetical protein
LQSRSSEFNILKLIIFIYTSGPDLVIFPSPSQSTKPNSNIEVAQAIFLKAMSRDRGFLNR